MSQQSPSSDEKGRAERLRYHKGKKGQTVLHLAARHGHVELGKAILDAFGRDQEARREYINQPGNADKTAMTLATENSHKAVEELLHKALE